MTQRERERERVRWPTPRSLEIEHGKKELKYRQDRGNRLSSLTTAVRLWPTPRSALGMNMNLTQGMADLQHKKYLETEVAYRENAPGGQLNPNWVEWLMGWPIGWTSPEPMAELLWLDWSVDPADMEAPEKYPTAIQGDWKGQKRKDGTAGMLSGIIQNNPQVSIGPIPRVATGIKDRVNRLKAIGNGQVPQCTELARKVLSRGR